MRLALYRVLGACVLDTRYSILRVLLLLLPRLSPSTALVAPTPCSNWMVTSRTIARLVLQGLGLFPGLWPVLGPTARLADDRGPLVLGFDVGRGPQPYFPGRRENARVDAEDCRGDDGAGG